MKLTNEAGLPGFLLRAIEKQYRQDVPEKDEQGREILRVSTLLKPPLATRLYQQHVSDLEEEAGKQVFRVLGSTLHAILAEVEPDPGDIIEKRLFGIIAMPDGREVVITGQPDIVSESRATIEDHKQCSIFSVKDAGKSEWEEQLNIYHWLVRQNNGPVIHGLTFHAYMRDWGPRYSKDFPYMYKAIPRPIWPMVKTVAFIQERLALYFSATPRDCTDEERWKKTDWKTGQVKYNRCEGYCAGAPWCPVLAREGRNAAAKEAHDGE